MKSHMLPRNQQTHSSNCRSLVVTDTSRSLIDRHKERELRRAEAEAHYHKTIWIKEPHDGEYRPVEERYEVQNERQGRELGYEKVEVGPTTNFVGNHMTQAAIDLVQAELESVSTSTSLFKVDSMLPDQ